MNTEELITFTKYLDLWSTIKKQKKLKFMKEERWYIRFLFRI